jgi:hypothetical protein
LNHNSSSPSPVLQSEQHGIGVAALASLLDNDLLQAQTKTGGLPDLPHFAAKAKG